jgi:CheY-like chemotaxis protein
MKLLYAEDERAMSEAVTDVLLYHKYSVDAVYDGQDALDYAHAEEYDGIILDVMMPKKSGLEVLRQLRAEGCRTPVLLLTAKAEVEDRIEGLDLGADDYLPKPFAMGELLARVRAMLRRREEFTPTVARFGDLALNQQAGELRCGYGMASRCRQSGSVTVQAIDGAEGLPRIHRCKGIAQRVHPVVLARMDGHTGWLIKETHVRILECHRDKKRRIWRDIGRVDHMQADDVAGVHDVHAAQMCPVHGHAGGDLLQAGDLPVGQTAFPPQKPLRLHRRIPRHFKDQVGHGTPPSSCISRRRIW